MASRFRLLSALLVIGVSLYAAARPVGAVPPLGPLLDPARGVWRAAAASELPRDAVESLPGLGAAVTVVYDDRDVPHIFAANEDDAVRALGYVVARDRLFQLELQTRAASGRITELAGARALELDREPRRLGMTRAAERKLAALDPASAGARAIAVYAEGVNAYIDHMSPADVPIEYRLLGARPERWKPIDSIHLLNRMGWTLSYGESDLQRERVAALVGRRAAEALLPRDMPLQEPIVPNGATGVPRLDGPPLPPPGPPDRTVLGDASSLAATLPASESRATDLARAGDALGSNNWAVAPGRTQRGRALLAGDPHLDLTLPSIWYEAHLVVPGKLDVYGVTIPGAPGIVIGFNRDVAWTFTNTEADAVDFYGETVDDSVHPTRYRVDGAWRPIERRVERYLGPTGALLAADTVLYTHRGPMRREGARWLSMRWTVLDPSNEMDALVRAAHARDAAEWFEAMRGWSAPAQNMLVADRAGTIAIRSTGHFPIRPAGITGAWIADGALSSSDWTGYRPPERYPYASSPAQGFLASANQQPVDPRTDSTYLGASWADPWRAIRINALLRADSAATPESMRRDQTDPGSARADAFVPAFLAAAASRERGRPDARLAEAARLLGEWDRRYTRDDRRAVLFELAMAELVRRTWDELAPRGGRRVATPPGSVLLRLLGDSSSAWWDDARTPSVRERRDDVLAASLRAALDSAERRHGAPSDSGWRWGRVQRANIGHLLGLAGFSRRGLEVQGGPSTLNPLAGAGTFGPSWRMVVELGDPVRAWGTYPGGQSGNPASRRYDDRIPKWQAGALEPLRLPRGPDALDRAHRSATLTLMPAGR